MPSLHHAGLHYSHFGYPPDTLKLSPQISPLLHNDQVRIKMICTPVNPSDLIPVTGAYPHLIQLPQTAGYEGIGVVTEVKGAAYQGLLHQRVLPLRGQGTWQQSVVCDAAKVIPVPAQIPDDIAARTYINPLAAFLLLKQTDVAGKTLVLTAAGSQCAQILASWALMQGAAHIYGITHTETHHADLRQQQITPLLDTDPALNSIFKKTDCVYDAVGGNLADQILQQLNPDAHFYSYGLLSGQPIRVYQAAVQPERFHLRDHIRQADDIIWQNWFAQLWPLIQKPDWQPPRFFSYQDWTAALQYFYQRDRRSKPMIQWHD